MTRGWGSKLAAGLTGLAAVTSPLGGVSAQQGPGLQITGTVEFGLDIDDNGALRPESPGTDTTLSTDLSLEIVSETPTSELALSFGATVQREDLADDDEKNGIQNPFISGSFTNEGPTTELSLSGSFRTRDLDDFVVSARDTGFVDDDLVISGGELETTDFQGDVTVDPGGPASVSLSYGFTDREYKDVTDPDLFDRRNEDARLTGTFKLSPVAEARVFVARSTYEAEDSVRTDRVTDSYGVGLDYEINPVLRLDGEVSQVEIDETEDVGAARRTTESDGIDFSLGLTRDLPDGQLRFSIDRNIYTDSSQTDYRISRDFDLPGASLSAALGLSEGSGSSTVVIGSLDYARDTPTGNITIGLERSATVNDEQEQRLRTSLNASYLYDVSPVSNVILGLDLVRSERLEDGIDSSTTNSELSITYRRDLTEDWSWDIGYVARRQKIGSGDSAHSNSIVTSLGRSFSIRP